MMMQTRIFIENSEQHLINAFDKCKTTIEDWSVLLCKFSMLEQLIDPDEFQESVNKFSHHSDTDIYFLENFDIGFAWNCQDKSIVEEIEDSILTHFKPLLRSIDTDNFFELFSTKDNPDQLHHHFHTRLKASQQMAYLRASQSTATSAKFTLAQEATLARSLITKTKRVNPEILVIEDQTFSRLLLVSILEKTYKCHAASNATEAIAVFANTAPNIVFIDVELPDISGHELTRLFKTFDRNIYIVMVTANNNIKDVELAKKNHIQGFIIKPFNKQRIFKVIDNYFHR
jgi:CheY-like chemotaxis protein